MKVILETIKIRDVFENYKNSFEEGILGFNGRLNIRPKYQREFVYKEKQQIAVIDTIRKGFPINVMYWVKNEDDSFEVLDGQQRTLSICEYVNSGFSRNFQFFHNLEQEEQEQILNYELMIYICEGKDREKLDWFRTINIAGEKLTEQELRNAVYTGEWLSDAKKYLSKTNCPAYNIGKDHLQGQTIRQHYLETVLDWVSGGNIEKYMAENQNKPNANELWLYFNNVMNWIKTIFEYRKELKGLDFGELYGNFGQKEIDTKELEKQIAVLMQDEEVTNKKGIFKFVLDKNEKHLNLRAFSPNQKREMFEKQAGICVSCKETFKIDEMEADHILAWSKGGKTNTENCQMLCRNCNRIKSNK